MKPSQPGRWPVSAAPAEMAQQIPQVISGLAGGISGAMSGLLQPLSQLPQQAARIGQQMMQTGMGAIQHGAGAAAAIPGELMGSTSGAGGLGGGGGGGRGGGATTPTRCSVHSRPSRPVLSPRRRVPTSSRHRVRQRRLMRRGWDGRDANDPAGRHARRWAAGKDEKPDTKRVVAPTVKNGAPVQGRITTPPPGPEVVKRVEGKPVASRRVVLPDLKRDDDDQDASR